MLIEILAIYFLFALIIFTVNYYIHLVRIKDTYTRNEIVNPIPGLSVLFNNLSEKYTSLNFIMITAVFSFLGIILTFGISHWIGRSALIPFMMIILFPFFKKFFSDSQVSSYDNYGDVAKNLFIKYNDIIIFSYALGAATSLIYCWGALREIGFIWFLINLLIISAGLTYMIQKSETDQHSA
jgi:hypothetical protein